MKNILIFLNLSMKKKTELSMKKVFITSGPVFGRISLFREAHRTRLFKSNVVLSLRDAFF